MLACTCGVYILVSSHFFPVKHCFQHSDVQTVTSYPYVVPAKPQVLVLEYFLKMALQNRKETCGERQCD